MSKFLAHGSTITIGGVLIGGQTMIGLPEQSRGAGETTDHNSGGDREYIPGLRDGGTFPLEGHQDPEDVGQVACRTNYAGDVAEAIVITMPATAAATAVTVSFDAFVTALGGDLSGDTDDPGSFSCTMKVSGGVTYTVAST